MPKVSVIIPIYSVEKYIARCAKSLFEQTLDEIEYIFINDCTPDDSINILKEILNQYPHRKSQVKIINMSKNSGIAAVRRRGIELATGEYIIHCDSDDWVNIQIYEKLYRKAIEKKSDVVFCDYYNSNGEEHLPITQNFGDLSKEKLLYTITQNNYWHLWGTLIKKDVFDNNHIIYPSGNNGEDFAIMLQVIHYTCNYFHLKEPLYYYYYNYNSISNNPTHESYIKRAEQLSININLIIDFFKREKIYNEIQDIIIMLKLYCRAHIAPISHIKKYKKIWYSIYPELEKTYFIFNLKIPLNLKINYLSVITNTYHKLKQIQSITKIRWRN